MTWRTSLSAQQQEAACHVGSHARLLAGPGTGKTLVMTRRICFLVQQKSVPADDILALTFTRAAAYELRNRVTKELGDNIPRISTLHSFALRQLLKNAPKLTSLPQPLRIADDWEERHIIQEDLKVFLKYQDIRQVRKRLAELSAGWQSLTADEADWDRRFPDPRFIGALREHKERYVYLLLSELVYQLKLALEQNSQFELEGKPKFLLVDEYQDLNRCDLAIVKAIATRGAELYVAGDDDQSIYGFREAHPEGIRRFAADYESAAKLSLDICQRCDINIIKLGLFVAEQDFSRSTEKEVLPSPNSGNGEVAILQFRDQHEEAQGVQKLCSHLLHVHQLEPHDILILIRSDRNRKFSKILIASLQQADIPVVTATEDANPLNTNTGRQALAILRIAANSEDHLAWRTLLQERTNGLGVGAIATLYEVAKKHNITFAKAIELTCVNKRLMPSPYDQRLESEVNFIKKLALKASSQEVKEQAGNIIISIADELMTDEDEKRPLVEHVTRILNISGAESLVDLVRVLEVSNERIEQELKKGYINLMTMHKAKGLTAKAVIIVAAEDEYLPGIAEQEDDERRLLYVSLTRAKHHLFITYCTQRVGEQRYSGRTSGNVQRTLTRFLRDAPFSPAPGLQYVQELAD